MPGFAAKITDQVLKDTSHHMVYPPGVDLNLGDVVVKSHGIWTPIANVADDLGFTFETVEDHTPGDGFSPTSSRGFSMEVKAEGEPGAAFKYVTEARAGVRVALAGDYSFVFSLADVRFRRIKSIPRFWDEVKSRRSLWTWPLERKVVTHLVTASSGTYLASGESEATFELEADAGVDVGGLTIADLATKFTLKSTMSAKDCFSSKTSITPLFQAYKVTLFGRPATAGLADGLEETELAPDDGSDD